MRLLLAILAVVGLLLTPVAASAASGVCLGDDEQTMSMTIGSTVASHAAHTADDSCCDPHGAPAKHQSQACAKACAAMCATVAAVLGDTATRTPAAFSRSPMEATPPKTFHAHPPPGLKRPPRTLA